MKKINSPSFAVPLVFILGTLFSAATFAQDSHSVAPDFNLPSDQGELSLSSYKGKVVYLDFWASWCQPCKLSFPWMNEMQEKYQDQGLAVLTINLDANIKDAQKFLAANHAVFKVAFDTQGTMPEQYGLKGMPTSYLIDPEGNIVLQHMGFHAKDKALLEKKLQQLLSQQVSSLELTQ